MLDLNTWRSAPMRFIASAIRRFTSYSLLPSAEKIDPKYLNLKTFLRLFPSQNIFS